MTSEGLKPRSQPPAQHRRGSATLWNVKLQDDNRERAFGRFVPRRGKGVMLHAGTLEGPLDASDMAFVQTAETHVA